MTKTLLDYKECFEVKDQNTHWEIVNVSQKRFLLTYVAGHLSRLVVLLPNSSTSISKQELENGELEVEER